MSKVQAAIVFSLIEKFQLKLKKHYKKLLKAEARHDSEKVKKHGQRVLELNLKIRETKDTYLDTIRKTNET